MCCRNRPPGQDLEPHRRASCRARQAETRGGLQLTWEERKLGWLVGGGTQKQPATHQKRRWGDWERPSPLKQLPDHQEAERDGQSRAQVLQFGEHLPVVVRQVGPAVALGEPDPVGPQPLAQSGEHPADWSTFLTARQEEDEGEEGGSQQIYLQIHSGADKRDERPLTGGD